MNELNENIEQITEVIMQSELERYGKSVKIEVNTFFNQWKAVIPYRRVMTKYSRSAKNLGLSLQEFSLELERLGFMRVVSDPLGKRYIIPYDCEWSEDELMSHLMEVANNGQATSETE